MYDFAIIGGGIIGLSTGMALGQAYPSSSILLLDKENHLASHQTGRNSGVIHSGIYYKPGSYKARFAIAGNRSMVAFCREHQIDHDLCGKIIVATEPKELPLLEDLYNRGLRQGLSVRRMSTKQVKEVEPYVRCVAAIGVASTGIVDYQAVSRKYAELIISQGGTMRLGTKVEKIFQNKVGHVLETDKKTFEAKFIINCAGLFSDRVARLGKVDPRSKIVPFRGEYYKLKVDKRYLVRNLIYPVPNPEFPFLGVHFTRMIDNSVHVGPNAVLSLKREGYKKTDFNLKDTVEILTYAGFWRLAAANAAEGLKEIARSFSKAIFVKNLQRLIPEITEEDLVPGPAGVRAQALLSNGKLVDDFLIVKGRNAIHVCNAPSPGATSSIEIGKAVVDHISL